MIQKIILGNLTMTDKEYKNLSRTEFDRAAKKFDNNDPSVYNICRKDCPDVLAEVVREPFSDLLDAGCRTGTVSGLFQRDHPDKIIRALTCQKR